MKKIGIYATDNHEIHASIKEMLERKTGKKTAGTVITHHRFLYDDGARLHGTHTDSSSEYGYKLVSLEELDLMPDYVGGKEMTVSEISEALGYNVKIVK